MPQSMLERRPVQDRVLGAADVLDALERLVGLATALPAARIAAPVRPAPLAALTEREREVLALMAEGRSNSAIAAVLVVSLRTVEAHVRAIFIKLDLPADAGEDRRVLAVLHHLRAVG